ncbi:MAG: RING finger protein [Bdellovibrionia bacterium]
MHLKNLKNRSIFSGFAVGIVLLIQQSVAYATPSSLDSQVVKDATLSLSILNINGLTVSGNSPSLEWFKRRAEMQSASAKAQLVWMKQLAEDKKLVESMNSTHTHLDHKDLKDLSEQRQECPICLEKLQDVRNIIVSKCGHLFCVDCFDSATSDPTHDTICPLCRKEDWFKKIIALKYTLGEEQDIVARVVSVDQVLNVATVKLDPKLGAGLIVPGDTTWYEIVRKKIRVWSCFKFQKVATDQVRLMHQSEARSYCSRRGARLPSRAELYRFRRNIGSSISNDLKKVAPWLSDISTGWFWSSESIPDDPDRFYAYDGVHERMTIKDKPLLGGVMCVRP